MGQSQSEPLNWNGTQICDLPNELLLGIFKLLSPQDRKAVVLVSKLWRDIGEDPRLWTWAVVTVNKREDLEKLKIPRLLMVKEITVTHKGHGDIGYSYRSWLWGRWLWGRDYMVESAVECHWMKEGGLPELVEAVSELPSVKMINGLEYCRGFQNIEPELVSRVLNRLEELKLCCGGDMILSSDKKNYNETEIILTAEQLELLFTACAEETRLKLLKVSGQPHMKEISPELFAAAVSNVEEVMLKEVQQEDTTTKQLEALYTAIATEERPLRKLIIYMDPRPIIDPDLMSRAFNKLEDITVFDGGSAEQLTAILRNMVEGDSRIKKMMIEDVSPEIIQNLDENLVRRVKEKVGEFFTVATLDPNQMFAVA